MVSLPTYDPGGTKLTNPAQANSVSADMFGGSEARALVGLGQTVQGVGGKLMEEEAKQKALDDTTAVTDAYGEAQTRMRKALYDPGGLYERTGKNAEGVTETALATADTIYADVSKKLTDPKQQQALKQMWGRYTESTGNAVSAREFNQRVETRTATKMATLGSITDDVIANFNDEEMLATNFDAAKAIIRANPDGAPDVAVKQLEAETISSLNVAVIQRLNQDSPGRALEYYERHKGMIVGADHATVHQMVSGAQNIRDARAAVDEVTAGSMGGANKLVRAVIGSESSGNVNTPDSPTGAAGLMQLQPDTARELAASMPGMGNVASMSNDELSAYWRTPEGQKANIRLGSNYLAKQMDRYKGDTEAALIAYNAGPGNADKWIASGRDYSKLPKPEETLPYVKKTLGKFLGVTINGETSDDIQRSAKGGATSYFKGDAPTFLKGKLQAQHGPEDVDDMNPALQTRLAGFLSEAPAGLDILSGARSVARQQKLWDASDKTGHTVARPGHSLHNSGQAADLGWNGGKFSAAPPEVKAWVAANAQRFGLKFPMSWENWHIEMQETRGGGAAKGDRLNAGDVQRGDQANIAARFAQQPPALGPTEPPATLQVVEPPPNPADLYLKSVAPFSLSASKDDLQSQLLDARDRYADNPSLLAEVERQLTDKSAAQIAAAKAEQDAAQIDVFKVLMNGGKVADVDQGVLLKAGMENVSKLLTMEGKIGKANNQDDTDEGTYYKLTQDPNFVNANLLDFADKLSKSDLKELADKQATLKRGSASARASDMTRTQIVTNAEQSMGLDPNTRPADAVKMGALNRALNLQIAGYTEQNKKDPTGPDIQKMVDDLVLQGHVAETGFDPAKRVFELSPGEAKNFYAAESMDDIPADVIPKVAQGYKSIWQVDPDKASAVTFYNDMVKVKLGAAPAPPPALDNLIRKQIAKKLGTIATPDQVANYYRMLILKSAADK